MVLPDSHAWQVLLEADSQETGVGSMSWFCLAHSQAFPLSKCFCSGFNTVNLLGQCL